MPYRGVWGVSWRGLWEVAWPLIRDNSRKSLIVGIVLALFMAVDKWLRRPDSRVVTALMIAASMALTALWLWIESRVRRHLRRKNRMTKTGPPLAKES